MSLNRPAYLEHDDIATKPVQMYGWNGSRPVRINSVGGVLSTGSVDEAIIVDDITTENITYVCKAAIGTPTSSAEWKIFILDETAGYLVIKWADGDNLYNNVADNRASLTYL